MEIAENLKALSSEQVKALYEAGLANPAWFLKTFMPDLFACEFSWAHYGIMALVLRKTRFLGELPDTYLRKIESHFTQPRRLGEFSAPLAPAAPSAPSENEVPLFHVDWSQKPRKVRLCVSPHTSIMMPRGFAKTTLFNGLIIYSIVYQLREVILLVSEAANHAKDQLATIKSQLDSNRRLITIFGPQRPPQRQGMTWREDQITTLSGCSVLTRGRGGQVRGINVRGQRPDLVLIDDVEDKESVSTEAQRVKCRNWFYEDLKPCLTSRTLKPEASMLAIGTLLHREAVLLRLRFDPEWISIHLSAEDRDGDLLWPEVMDEARLAREKESFASQGNLAGFYREYYNQLRNLEDAIFRPSDIIYEPPPPLAEMRIALALDPAVSEKKESDLRSLVAVGLDRRGVFWILDERSDNSSPPHKVIDWIFEFHERWKPSVVGIETIAFQKVMEHLVREAMFRRRTYFEIKSIGHHSNDKLTRVQGALAPRYRAGMVRHARRLPAYEAALLDWPNGYLDPPDAAAMAISLLDPFPFSSANGAEAASKAEKVRRLPSLELLVGDRRAI